MSTKAALSYSLPPALDVMAVREIQSKWDSGERVPIYPQWRWSNSTWRVLHVQMSKTRQRLAACMGLPWLVVAKACCVFQLPPACRKGLHTALIKVRTMLYLISCLSAGTRPWSGLGEGGETLHACFQPLPKTHSATSSAPTLFLGDKQVLKQGY